VKGFKTQDSEFKIQNSKIKIQDSRFRIFVFSLLTIHFSLFLSGCSKQDRIYRESRISMDTICTITIVSSSKRQAKEAVDAGFAEIKRLEGLLNFFSPDSEITAINRSSGYKPVRVSKETLVIIKKAVRISDYTDGAFDPAVGPLMRLWGFSDKGISGVIPTPQEIKNILPLVDYRKIKINDSTSEIFLEKKGMELDLGGIAKGYAADKAIEVIKSRGIKAALVAIGGDIRGYGLKPDKKPWRVGIQNPRPKSENIEPQAEKEDIFVSLYLKDAAISTSGDYQRSFIKDGVRYHHILDPKTGFPAGRAMSVSVIAPEGYMADAISTGVFVLGPEKGIKLLESLGLSGIIVDVNKKIFLTKDLQGKITIEKTL